ncbi:hypothetical protein FOA52_006918 [Chlamydomonas sp. UWO 241]|nr:hypothetical protein FOA52_006918 [Chlamydomonas sp. UWO 241]
MRATRATSLVALVLALAASCAGPAAVLAQEPCDPCVRVCDQPDNGDANFVYLPEIGFTIKDLRKAVACLHAITVPYDLAWQTATSLAKFWNENYVFNDMAKDPLATPHTSGLIPINPYTKGVDVAAELNAMADSWPVDQPVPFYDVSLRLNSFFNTLRDGHVLPFDSTSVVARVLMNININLIDRTDHNFLDGHSPKLTHAAGALEPALNLTYTVDGVTTTKVVESIDGVSWVEWCRGQVTGLYPVGYVVARKNIGQRINAFMARLIAYSSPFPFILYYGVGDIEPLMDKVYAVRFTDGSATTWQWVAVMNRAFMNVTSGDLSHSVSTNPSTLYQKLYLAGDAYYDRNSTVQMRRSLLPASGGRSLAGSVKDERPLRPDVFGAAAAVEAAARAAETVDPAGRGGAGGRSLAQSYTGAEMAGMSNDSAWGSNLIRDSNGNTVGAYAIVDGSNATGGTGKYAVWKLNTFDFSAYAYVPAWVNFVKMATDAGVTRLMYDVSGVPGGLVSTAYQAAALLFPELADADAPRNEYDMAVGSATAYIISNGLLPGSRAGAVPRALALAANATYIGGRVDTVRSVAGLFDALAVKSTRTLAAMNVFLDTGLLQQSVCESEDADGVVTYTFTCSDVYDALLVQIRAALDPVVADPVGRFDDGALGAIIEVMRKGMFSFQPLNVQEPMGQGFDLANPFAPPVERTRGGVTALYSQPFHLKESNTDGGKFSLTRLGPLLSAAGLPTPYVSPFKSILAISNGACGSACATWGITSWLHSKTTPGALPFKWLTYGGTGKRQNLQPVSFPGGFTSDSSEGMPLTPKLWAYWAFTTLLADWIGYADLVYAAEDLRLKIPEFPALGNNIVLPSFPQGELFSHVLGGAAGSAPAEYLQWPTDHYLRRWYLDAVDVSGADVWPLYADAAAFLPPA